MSSPFQRVILSVAAQAAPTWSRPRAALIQIAARETATLSGSAPTALQSTNVSVRERHFTGCVWMLGK